MKKYRIRKKDRSIKGSIRLSGSKSISNRVLMIEALSGKKTGKENLSDSSDTKTLHQLLSSGEKLLDARDAGTAFRFLTAYCALKEGEWTLTGTERMQQRPISDLVGGLRSLGAEIGYQEKENFPPLKIIGGNLSGNFVRVKSDMSSQFVSALLMIGPLLGNGLTIELAGEVVSEPYIEMTLQLMKFFGVSCVRNENRITVAHQDYVAGNIFIESDWSAAAFYYEIAAFAEEPDLHLEGLMSESLQGDSVLQTLCEELGVQSIFKSTTVVLSKIKPSKDFHFNLKNFPDLAPSMIVSCAGLSLNGKFSGLSHLKYKESNREEALRQELSKCGIELLNKNGELIVQGKFLPGKYEFNTYNDHRMAMSLAPLAMICEEVTIIDPDVVNKSYPLYWDDLRILGFEINEIV